MKRPLTTTLKLCLFTPIAFSKSQLLKFFLLDRSSRRALPLPLPALPHRREPLQELKTETPLHNFITALPHTPAKMNSLPPELLPAVLAHLPASSLPLLASLSRTHQLSVESIAFRSLHIVPSDLGLLAKYLPGPSDPLRSHRRQLLRRLEYEIVLEGYGLNRCRKIESYEMQRKNDRIFTDGIFKLFTVLREWDMDGAQQGHIYLVLSGVWAPMDPTHRPAGPEMDRYWNDHSTGTDLGWMRFRHSYLRLSAEGGGGDVVLPRTRQVKDAEIVGRNTRRIHAGDVARIVGALEGVESVVLLGLGDEEMLWADRRQEMRKDFGSVLLANCKSGVFDHLRSLTLCLCTIEPNNHSLSPAALHPSSPSTDHLSLALNAVSRLPHLSILKLTTPAALSPSLFWPPEFNSTPSLASWPALEVLEVDFTMLRPDGTWYFTGDPRTVKPDDELVPPGGDIEPPSDRDYESDSSAPDVWPRMREGRAEGSIPSHRWRTALDQAKWDDVVLALGKMVAKAAKVRRVRVGIHGQAKGSGARGGDETPQRESWEGWYLGVGERLDRDGGTLGVEDDTAKRRWLIKVEVVGNGAGWQAVGEVARVLKHGVGPEGVVKVVTIGKPRPRSRSVKTF
ncbi:hypothetical protein BDZ91DRAFT_742706 [Kalaharituber pfeilii]|nr:hypothetical protein BDZ91DRAFT_742706 [Kalaharituber pfeilii]